MHDGVLLETGAARSGSHHRGLHSKECMGWRKNRLLAVKLAAQGQMTSAEVADVCGISRGHLFEWLKAVRTGGIEELLSMGRRGRPEGWRKGISKKVMEAFEAMLKAGEFITMKQARKWLSEEHGIETDYQRMWYWVKSSTEQSDLPILAHSNLSWCKPLGHRHRPRSCRATPRHPRSALQ